MPLLGVNGINGRINGPVDGGLRFVDLAQGQHAEAEVAFEHNTGFARSHAMIFDGDPNASFVFRDNLITRGTYGVFGSGKGEGKSALEAFAPGYVFEKNAIVGAPEASYPAGNFFPAAVADVRFASATNHQLASDSPYAKKASDGTDLGADFAALAKATSGVAP